MAKISWLALVLLLSFSAEGGWAQSLWSPGFKGYLTGSGSLQVGDLISVTIDTNTKLSYSSSNVSDRTVTIEFKGAAAGNPLSFLSPGTTGEKSSLKGGEEITLTTRLVARVEKLDSNGNAFVQGSRTLQVNGRDEMVTVSGWVAPRLLSNGKSVGFTDLADSKLVYSSTLIQTHPVLTQGDITQALSQATGGPGASQAGASPPSGASTASSSAPGSGPSAATSPTTGTPSSGSAAPVLQINEAKKRQLLIEYLNKMLDLIFSKGTP